MKKKEKCLNEVILSGTVVKDFELDHYEVGIKYFICEVECKRHSGVMDVIKVMANEYQVDTSESWIGEKVEITGEYRSFNYKDENRWKLKLFVKSKTFQCISEHTWHNETMLTGYICSKPQFRDRNIKKVCNVTLAIPRYDATDYIPCIFWGPDALAAVDFKVGKKITVLGRLQSRTYLKREEAGLFEKICWEVSVKGYREE